MRNLTDIHSTQNSQCSEAKSRYDEDKDNISISNYMFSGKEVKTKLWEMKARERDAESKRENTTLCLRV